jgi:hypothetical protein
MNARDVNDSAPALAVIATWRPAAICAHLALSDAARACLAEAPAAPAWLAALLRAGCQRDAVTFLAHALPRAQAVRWACDCVEAGGGGADSQAARGALAAARAWARAPGDGGDREAAAAAEACAEGEGAARFAAFGAAWSGVSLAPEGQPVVAPAASLGAAAVAAAVLLAAADGPPAGRRQRLDDFVGRGVLAAAP